MSTNGVEPVVDSIVEVQKDYFPVHDFRCQSGVGSERVRKVDGHGRSFNEDEVGIKSKRTLLKPEQVVACVSSIAVATQRWQNIDTQGIGLEAPKAGAVNE